jgi:hypothetical protein
VKPLLVAITALASVAPLASAQLPECTDSLPRDTLRVVVALAPPNHSDPSGDTLSLLLAQTIARHLIPPSPLDLPSWPGTIFTVAEHPQMPTDLGASLGLTGELLFREDSKGNLKLGTERATTGSPNLNTALLAALTATNQLGELAPVAVLIQPRPDTVRLRVTWSTQPVPLTVTLFRARLVAVRADTPPLVLHLAPAVFPPDAIKANVGASFTVQYVIDADGNPVPRSLRVLTSEYREFVAAAFDAILQGRYAPARAQGCPVPALVMQTVRFAFR